MPPLPFEGGKKKVAKVRKLVADPVSVQNWNVSSVAFCSACQRSRRIDCICTAAAGPVIFGSIICPSGQVCLQVQREISLPVSETFRLTDPDCLDCSSANAFVLLKKKKKIQRPSRWEEGRSGKKTLLFVLAPGLAVCGFTLMFSRWYRAYVSRVTDGKQIRISLRLSEDLAMPVLPPFFVLHTLLHCLPTTAETSARFSFAGEGFQTKLAPL